MKPKTSTEEATPSERINKNSDLILSRIVLSSITYLALLLSAFLLIKTLLLYGVSNSGNHLLLYEFSKSIKLYTDLVPHFTEKPLIAFSIISVYVFFRKTKSCTRRKIYPELFAGKNDTTFFTLGCICVLTSISGAINLSFTYRTFINIHDQNVFFLTFLLGLFYLIVSGAFEYCKGDFVNTFDLFLKILTYDTDHKDFRHFSFNLLISFSTINFTLYILGKIFKSNAAYVASMYLTVFYLIVLATMAIGAFLSFKSRGKLLSLMLIVAISYFLNLISSNFLSEVFKIDAEIYLSKGVMLGYYTGIFIAPLALISWISVFKIIELLLIWIIFKRCIFVSEFTIRALSNTHALFKAITGVISVVLFFNSPPFFTISAIVIISFLLHDHEVFGRLFNFQSPDFSKKESKVLVSGYASDLFVILIITCFLISTKNSAIGLIDNYRTYLVNWSINYDFNRSHTCEGFKYTNADRFLNIGNGYFYIMNSNEKIIHVEKCELLKSFKLKI